MRLIIFSILAVLLASCGTTPIVMSEASAVPQDRIYIAETTGDSYQIRITRDSGRQGSACASRVYLNGKAAADLRPEETVIFRVPPGRHLLGASQSPTGGRLCTAFNEVARSRHETEVTAGRDEVRNYRLAITGSGELRLDPTAF